MTIIETDETVTKQVAEVAALEVRDLRVSYAARRGVRTEVVHGVSLRVEPGEVVALVGQSGSGKTTIAQSVLGLLAPGGKVDAGQVLLAGTDIAHWSDKRLQAVRGLRLALVPQDPGASLNPVRRIGDTLAEVLRIHHWGTSKAIRAKVIELLDQVGIPDPVWRARQYPHELSGGMKQRVLIASALALNPDVLVADEPTSALDVTVQKQVLDLIDELRWKHGTSVLLVTHDLGVAADRADSVVVLEHGVVREFGCTSQLLANPQDSYTRRLLADAPSLSVTGPDWGTGNSTIAVAARLDTSDVPRRWSNSTIARTAGSDTTGAPDIDAPNSSLTSDASPSLVSVQAAAVSGEVAPLLQVRDLVVDFGRKDQAFRAVDEVSFDVQPGTTHAIVGESGSGKTTTARVVAGFQHATSGAVLLDGEDLTQVRGSRWRQLRPLVQLVYQNPFSSLDPRQTIEQTVAEPLRNIGLGRSERKLAARNALDQVGLPSNLLARRARELSGGQRQRVAIARAIVLHPKLTVLDEAVSALDVTVQAQILDLLTQIQQETGTTYLFISHDLAVISQIAETVTVLSKGQVVEAGLTVDVFSNPQHPYTQELVAAVPGRRRVISKGILE